MTEKDSFNHFLDQNYKNTVWFSVIFLYEFKNPFINHAKQSIYPKSKKNNLLRERTIFIFFFLHYI